MKKIIILLLFVQSTILLAQSTQEIARWKKQASHVEIIRDTYGVPHIYGNTNADAVFGLLYAQCEDDFARVERNYIEKLGRLSELDGETALANDLYVRLIIDEAEAKKDYHQSPAWLKQLLHAYADGINYYLYKHPKTKPALLTHFEPWYPLLWTDGSIGAISTGDVNEKDVASFYGLPIGSTAQIKQQVPDESMTGSNGFAVGPSLSKSGNSMLYINPHVTFYFRPEVHMQSKQGLHVYGAVTWGQFFIYQGFNPYGGWMHTSSQVDVADMYAENVREVNGIKEYEVDGTWRPLRVRSIQMAGRTIKTYYTHRGPVMANRDGRWISVKSYNRSLRSLEQSWLRTQTKGLDDFKRIMDMRANTSNNTVYADKFGHIAYWHGNYVPKRDPSIDWSTVQDGRFSKNDWTDLHSVNEIVHVLNPSSGFVQNCNSTPFQVAGKSSPLPINYPAYMAPDGNNFRNVRAQALFAEAKPMDLQELMHLGYDRKLAAFERILPVLIRQFDAKPVEALKPLIDVMRTWDYQADTASVAQTLAIRWGLKMIPHIPKARMFGGETDIVQNMQNYVSQANEAISYLADVKMELERDFGTWQIAWGQLNRFQRISNNVIARFDDQLTSIPVPYTSSLWGQLPSYTSRPVRGTKKWYGVNGNSFVCTVEFGKTIKAYSLLAGGESGDPESKHFFDQANDYAIGKFKPVFFYRQAVLRNQVRRYKP